MATGDDAVIRRVSQGWLQVERVLSLPCALPLMRNGNPVRTILQAFLHIMRPVHSNLGAPCE